MINRTKFYACMLGNFGGQRESCALYIKLAREIMSVIVIIHMLRKLFKNLTLHQFADKLWIGNWAKIIKLVRVEIRVFQ